MSGVHCQRFPDCMELNMGNTMPKCDRADCPGKRTWNDVFASGAPSYDGSNRPVGSNADEWALFLSEHRDALPFLAVQIAEALDEAEARGRGAVAAYGRLGAIEPGNSH
jgi:hypothetical protein